MCAVELGLGRDDEALEAELVDLVHQAGHRTAPVGLGEVLIADRRWEPRGGSDPRTVIIADRAFGDTDNLQRLWRSGASDCIVIPGEGHRLASALARAANAAAELRRARTMSHRLLDSLVHDLRSPLGVVRLNLDLLREGRQRFPPEEQHQILEETWAANERALGLLADLVEIHRVEAGDVEPSDQPLDLSALIARCCARLRDATEARQTRLQPPRAQEVTILGDAATLARALELVLASAVGHAPRQTEVVIDLEVSGSQAMITIENRGASIASEAQARIFDRGGLLDLDASGVRAQYRGRGLGLYLGRLLVESQRGQIGCSDRRDGSPGVRFLVRFPLAA